MADVAGEVQEARALINEGLFGQAAGKMTVWLRDHPDDDAGWRVMAVAQVKLGKWEAALAACKQAVRLCPDDASRHCELGIALREVGKPEQAEQAEQALLEAVRLRPSSRRPWEELVGIYDRQIPSVADVKSGQAPQPAGESAPQPSGTTSTE